jgi:AcrR family transcriptional regulator
MVGGSGHDLVAKGLASPTDLHQGAPRDPRDRKEQILRTAVQLFYEQGFAETTMQDIGRAVGLLKGSLYHHIRSKEQLLFEILRDLHSTSLALIDQIDYDSNAPLEQLDIFLRGLTVHGGRNAIRLTIFFRDFRYLSDNQQREIISEREIYNHAVRRLIAKAQHLGQVHAAIDSKLAAIIALDVCAGVHQWYRVDGPRSIESIAEESAGLTISGIRGYVPA